MTKCIETRRLFRRAAISLPGMLATVTIGSGLIAGAACAQWNGHDRDYHHNWNGGYYRAPPVVYGSTYGYSYYGAPNYYPPPVIYGPAIAFPGVVIRVN